ncbi:ABC transporter permease [Nonomuraea longicatena]|uniref:ABC3 transporter permease C-terminal domain-containing protein n=1 Tax=Nonomuraea longicatena TaxID=83682 RepID=A0ABN1P2I6_9ACTN
MSAFRAALRLSRRDALRAKGRTALILLMIGLPVLVVTGALTLFATAQVDLREELPYRLGAADAHIDALHNGRPVKQTVEGAGAGRVHMSDPLWTTEAVAALVKGRVIPNSTVWVDLLVDGVLKAVVGFEVDLREPMTKGMRTLVEGRFPASTGEIAVSSSLAEAGGRIGETLKVSRKGVPLKVVGITENPVRPTEDEVFALRGAMMDNNGNGGGTGWLLDATEPVTWEQVRRLNAVGLVVQSRALIENPPASAPGALRSDTSITADYVVILGVMVVMVVMEIVLMAGSAFAVGLRRRRHELAVLAAQGASPAHLRLVVAADGLVLGGAATLAGTVIGVPAGLAVLSLLSPSGLAQGPADVPWGQVVSVAALGLVSGVVSALIPAFQAGRTAPAQVLAGRDPAGRDRAGWPVLGLLLVVAGVGLIVKLFGGRVQFVIAACVLVILGVVVLTPWLVRRTAGLASGRALAVRLAVRDAVRHRGRTASAVAAVMAAAAAVVALSITLHSKGQNLAADGNDLPDGVFTVSGALLDESSWTRARAEVERRLPTVRTVGGYAVVNGKDEFTLSLMQGRTGYAVELNPVVGDGEALELAMGGQDERAVQALSAGKAVVFRPGVVKDGRVGLGYAAKHTGKGKVVEVEAVEIPIEDSHWISVIPPSAVRKIGLSAVPRVLYGLHDVPDPERFAGQIKAVVWDAEVRFPWGDNRSMAIWIMVGAAAFLMLGGTFVATGLAAADLRRDLNTMAAVGAAPRTRRRIVAAQAGYISGLGALMGLLVGLPMGLALAWPAGAVTIPGPSGFQVMLQEPTIAIPWLPLALVVVGLPLLAALVAGLFAPTRMRLARRLT